MAIETVYTRTPGEAAAALSAAVLGVTTGAAVETDAAGTIQQYLRGLVALAAGLSATDFASEATLLSMAMRLSARKLGTTGQVLSVSSESVLSAQLAVGLWELTADKPLWYKQGNLAVDAERGVAGSAFLYTGQRRLLVVTGTEDDYVSIVAGVNPATTFEAQIDVLNQLKADYEAHRVLTPTVHAHADTANAVTAVTAVDSATALLLANDIKTQYTAHLAEENLVSECCTLLTEMKGDYNAHRILEGGPPAVHGAPDATNVIDEADATTYSTALTLANQMRAMYEAHRVLIAGGEHGAADATNAITALAASSVSSLAELCVDLKTQYEAHRVLTVGSVHGAVDGTNDVTADDPGTADVHIAVDTTHAIASPDATDLDSLTLLVAELWTDYNGHLGTLTSHGAADTTNLVTWGTASLTLEE